jgi:hypothetical protein
MKKRKHFTRWRKQTKEAMSDMASKRLFRILLPVSLLFLVLSVVVPYIYLFPEAGGQIAVPLHYNIHFGVDLFGEPWRVFVPAIVGGWIFLVNILLSISLWRSSRILSYGLLCATAVMEMVLFVATVFVTLLVLSYL